MIEWIGKAWPDYQNFSCSPISVSEKMVKKVHLRVILTLLTWIIWSYLFFKCSQILLAVLHHQGKALRRNKRPQVSHKRLFFYIYFLVASEDCHLIPNRTQKSSIVILFSVDRKKNVSRSSTLSLLTRDISHPIRG